MMRSMLGSAGGGNRGARLTGLALGLLLALVPVACGDDGSSDDEGADDAASEAASGSGSGPAASGDWPVVVEHRHGETTVEERPERIVTLDVQWTDVLLAMGVEPQAYLLDRTSGEEGTYPWQGDQLDDVTLIEMTGELPLEEILEQDPDLILGTWLVEEGETYDDLSQIAPTIPLLSDRQVDPWQDMIEVAGRFLGDPGRAQEVTDEVDQLLADTAAELPGLEGRTFLMANYLPGDSITVVVDPEDGASVFFQDLGMELSPTMVAEADGAVGRVQLSFELVDRMDADLLVVLPNGGDPADLPGWSELPAVQGDSVVEMDFAEVVGLNTPTPLSVPYALDLVRPALESVAQADA